MVESVEPIGVGHGLGLAGDGLGCLCFYKSVAWVDDELVELGARTLNVTRSLFGLQMTMSKLSSSLPRVGSLIVTALGSTVGGFSLNSWLVIAKVKGQLTAVWHQGLHNGTTRLQVTDHTRHRHVCECDCICMCVSVTIFYMCVKIRLLHSSANTRYS